jgi:hypothetical protein
MAEKNNDPVAVWRKMFDDMEKAFNAFTLRAMTPPQFSKTPGGPGEAASAAKAQVDDLTGRLDSIEMQLGEIKALLRDIKEKPARQSPPRAKASGQERK